MKKLFTYFIALSFALCMFAAPSMACQEANGSSATISTDEKSGGIGSGGLGISGGSAGYKSFPWIQAIALRTK